MPGGQLQRLLGGAKFDGVAPMTGDPLLAERTELEVFTQLLDAVQGCVESFGGQAIAAGSAYRGLSDLLARHWPGEGRGSDPGASAVRQMGASMQALQQRLTMGREAMENLAQTCAASAGRSRYIQERFEARDRAWSVCRHYEEKVQRLQTGCGDAQQAERLARNREKLRRSEGHLQASMDAVRRVIGEALSDKQQTLCGALASLCGCYVLTLGDLAEPLRQLGAAKQALESMAAAPTLRSHASGDAAVTSHVILPTTAAHGTGTYQAAEERPSRMARSPRPTLDMTATGTAAGPRGHGSPSGRASISGGTPLAFGCMTPTAGSTTGRRRSAPSSPGGYQADDSGSGGILVGGGTSGGKTKMSMEELYKLPLRDLRTLLAGTGVTAPLGMTDKADLVSFVHGTLHAEASQQPTSPKGRASLMKNTLSDFDRGGAQATLMPQHHGGQHYEGY